MTTADRIHSLDSSFVLLAREGSDSVELLTGTIVDVDLLADIPLDADGARREVFALVPFRQVRERGFEAQDDGAPLRCLLVDEHLHLPAAEVLAALPATPVPLHDGGFDLSDDEYAAIVERVIADEIGRGEGANFVIRRDYTARIDATDSAAERTAALTWFRALLEHERGAYWTFVVVTPGVIAVGASPEAHVVAQGGVVTMNPISGTFRHPAGGSPGPTSSRCRGSLTPSTCCAAAAGSIRATSCARRCSPPPSPGPRCRTPAR